MAFGSAKIDQQDEIRMQKYLHFNRPVPTFAYKGNVYDRGAFISGEETYYSGLQKNTVIERYNRYKNDKKLKAEYPDYWNARIIIFAMVLAPEAVGKLMLDGLKSTPREELIQKLKDDGLQIDDNSYDAVRQAYSAKEDVDATADEDDEWLDDDDADKVTIDTRHAMFEYPIQIRQTSYSKEKTKKQYNARSVVRQQIPNATQSTSTAKHRNSDDVKTASASKDKSNNRQRGIEPKKSGRSVAYVLGGIVAFLMYAVTFTFVGYVSGYLIAMTPMDYYNPDVLGYHLWMLTIKLIVGVPCFIGAAWITTRLLYCIPLGYRGEKKYYVTAAEVITFFAIIALLGLNIAECIMIAVHAYYIRKFGTSLAWISVDETTREERKRKPRTYNQKAYLIGLLVMAVVIAAIIGYNVIATRSKDQVNGAGESTTSVTTESQMVSAEDTADESEQEVNNSRKVYESAAEQAWYDSGYNDGYNAGKEAWNTGASTYDSSGSGADEGSQEEDLYKEGYSDGYKLGLTEDRDAALIQIKESLDAGAITQEEYEQRRQEILGH